MSQPTAYNYDYYNSLRQNPEVMKFLNVIAMSEGTMHGANPYASMGGSRDGQLTSLATHPGNLGQGQWTYTNHDGKVLPSSANGKYAIIKGTFNGLNNQFGGRLTFSEQDQDIAALALIKGRGQLQNVLDGNYRAAIEGLGAEWASLPSADQSKTRQGKRDWQFIANAFNTVGLNSGSLGIAPNGVVKGVNLGGKYPVSGTTSTSANTMAQFAGAQLPELTRLGKANVPQPQDPLSQQMKYVASPEIRDRPFYSEALKPMQLFKGSKNIYGQFGGI